MFLISFLKSLESHYPVSGLLRFWIFQKLNTTICWKLAYTSGYSRLTFDISEELYRRKQAAAGVTRFA